ncbi:hypothetical protein POTTS_275 [Klebsiella phage vB_KpnM_Potts1]|uniref:Uncharacterized protein n=1 Tax=Klebsiella phage vB_KpnM_Potts1 TaxID=2591366 RepID=A0A5B9NFA1_9CAUD|nr:hypothetical protein POTTS_275 [Klebsiella phage vB_KpnM_Potts1]
MYGLFMWSRYYPSGGTGDFVGCYSSVEEAIKEARDRKDFNDKYEVVSSSFCSVTSGYTNEL